MSDVLGLLFAIMVGLTMIPRFASYQQQGLATQKLVLTGQEQAALVAAASQYGQQYATTIEATATSTSPVTVSVATLLAANVGLPVGFNATNPFGQTWTVQFLQPTSGTLQGLVFSTGGTTLTDAQGSQIAQAVGQPGGLIPKNDSGIFVSGGAQAYGNGGGWHIATAGYSGITVGHPAALVTLAGSQTESPYLYRSAVPGQSQLNTMNTSIDMGTNSITDADTIAASAVSASSVSVQNTNGAAVSFNADSILQNGNMVYETNGVHQFRNDGNTSWQAIQTGSVTANGAVTSTTYLKAANSAVPEASCSPNGAHESNSDGSGQGLTCVFGAWVPDGGRWQVYGEYAVANGSVVPSPTCSSGGVGKILLNAQSFYVDDTATVNYGPASGSGPWTVTITDGSGAGVTGTGMATTYCAY